MHGTALSIAPDANIIHLMHGLPGFDVTAAARTMETVRYLPVGSHVCVCDPGVGTARRAMIIQVARGDFLVGPDNGVLLPATRMLGGIVAAHQITNGAYMREPVSPLFHGRDIFSPAAAHLTNGVPIADFGPAVEPASLVAAPYEEARDQENGFAARVIQINKFGSLHLNILHEQWDKRGIVPGDRVCLVLDNHKPLEITVGLTFGDVPEGDLVVMRDDYGRIEVAKNLGAFTDDHPVEVGATAFLDLSTIGVAARSSRHCPRSSST